VLYFIRLISFCPGKSADGDSECEKSVYIRQHVHILHSLVNMLFVMSWRFLLILL